MGATLDKPLLWNFTQTAELLGLKGENGRKAVASLVEGLKIQPKSMNAARQKGLDRDDIDRLAKALGQTLQWPDRGAD